MIRQGFDKIVFLEKNLPLLWNEQSLNKVLDSLVSAPLFRGKPSNASTLNQTLNNNSYGYSRSNYNSSPNSSSVRGNSNGNSNSQGQGTRVPPGPHRTTENDTQRL